MSSTATTTTKGGKGKYWDTKSVSRFLKTDRFAQGVRSGSSPSPAPSTPLPLPPPLQSLLRLCSYISSPETC
uniref:Uncharacterized protein n=1 Tax=Fagus sylvatica TaxID=28930 RepID=A0A2N9FBT3_FAGSY